MVQANQFIEAGDWRTLHRGLFGMSDKAYFLLPVGAEVRVIYGFGPFSTERDRQTLDGENYKEVSFGIVGSLGLPRIQIRVPFNTNVEFFIGDFPSF